MTDQTEFDSFFRYSRDFDSVFSGLNVLDGLIHGIDEFVANRDSSWYAQSRAWPVMIGSSLWLDDTALISKLPELSGCCVLMRKQSRDPSKLAQLATLEASARSIRPLAARAFPRISHLRPSIDGEPDVVGPGTEPLHDLRLGPFRTVGTRRKGKKRMVPHLHAKIALLGWTAWGEDDWGSEVQFFRPSRLWVSSANFTRSSRRSIEFGMWTEDPKALDASQSLLENLLTISEPLDPVDDHISPELVEPEFDIDAFAEYMADYEPESDGLD